MIKKTIESLLLITALNSFSGNINELKAETWNQFFDEFQSNSSLRKQSIDDYKNTNSKERAEFDLHYFMRFKKDFKEENNFSWNFPILEKHENLFNVEGSAGKLGSFSNAIKRFVNTNCNGISCLDYLDKRLDEESKNFPNSIVDGNKKINFKSNNDKKKFLMNYYISLSFHESGIYNTQVSEDNAIGFFQITPCTGRLLGFSINKDNYSISNNQKCSNKSLVFNHREQIYDERILPTYNIDGAIKLNNAALKKYKDMQYALADQIGGPRGVKAYQNCVKNKIGCDSSYVKEIKGLVKPVTTWKRRLDKVNK